MKAFFITIIILSAIFSFAQPVINYSTHAPNAGDLNSYSGVDFKDPGMSGKNVVWDFSEITPNGKTTYSQQSVVDDYLVSKFEFSPDIVLEENGNKFFHSLNQSSYSITGIINADFEINYHKPLTRMIYPFAYSDYFEGELKATSINTANTDKRTEISGNYTIFADAYGEIILPGGIHKNVLRVHQYSTSVQVTACTEVNIESHKYLWYSAQDRYPIATTITQDKRYCNGKVESSSDTWINNKYLNLEISELELNSDKFTAESVLNVFPNPFKENTAISVFLNEDSEISIAIYNATGIKVEDICKSQFLKKGTHNFEITQESVSLKPGLYFVKLYTKKTTVVQKLIRNQ